MQEAGLSELTARVSALEAVTNTLLGLAMARDGVFAEAVEAAARDAGEVADGVSDAGMRFRLRLYATAFQDAVEAAQRLAPGFRATER